MPHGTPEKTTSGRSRSGRSRAAAPLKSQLGGWGSNPRPADYENYGPALPTLYLHGYHGAAPPMAPIAPVAPMARSTTTTANT